MASRHIPNGVRAVLVAFSARTCYYLGCNDPLLDKVDGKYRMVLERAYIRALHEDGARYDADMTDAERNDFLTLSISAQNTTAPVT